jgi:hypothetical protein
MNLWSDFDNTHQQPPQTPVHGRARRLTEQAVLSSLRDWLLHDYAAAYCRSLGATRIFRRCYWVDALGLDARANAASQVPAAAEPQQSRGRKKGAAQVATAPALQPIVALSQALAQESRPIALYGLILEAGSRHKEARARGTTPAADANIAIPLEGGIIRANWLTAAPALLKAIEASPAIFLLNPFGHTIFGADDLAALHQRTIPTELCLLVAHKQLEARWLAALHTPALAATLTRLLRTDRWKTISIREGEREQAIDSLLDLFIAAMQRHFQFPIQRIPLLMLARPAVVENVPYTLIFATRRQDSLYSMNDALCLHRRCLYERSYRGVLEEEWFLAQQRERLERELQQLYRRTQQQGRARQIRRWPELRQHMLLASFGQFTTGDYDSIIYQLLLNKEVRCEWRRALAGGEGPRLPGNDDTLLWQ